VGPSREEIQNAAQAFARALNCLNHESVPCGACVPCRLAAGQKFADLINIFPDGAVIKIDQIREVKDLVKFGPHQGKYLVVVINGAETLTPEAANSFLKILEEPLPGVVFILVAKAAAALLSTIKSRCHHLVFSEKEVRWSGEEELFKQMAEALGKKDVVALFKFSGDFAEEKDNLEEYLLRFGLYLRQNWQKSLTGGTAALKVILKTIESIKRKAAVRLAMDAMFLRLLEEG
jgi:DNA polymerase III gamma/tau subunit